MSEYQNRNKFVAIAEMALLVVLGGIVGATTTMFSRSDERGFDIAFTAFQVCITIGGKETCYRTEEVDTKKCPQFTNIIYTIRAFAITAIVTAFMVVVWAASYIDKVRSCLGKPTATAVAVALVAAHQRRQQQRIDGNGDDGGSDDEQQLKPLSPPPRAAFQALLFLCAASCAISFSLMFVLFAHSMCGSPAPSDVGYTIGAPAIVFVVVFVLSCGAWSTFVVSQNPMGVGSSSISGMNGSKRGGAGAGGGGGGSGSSAINLNTSKFPTASADHGDDVTLDLLLGVDHRKKRRLEQEREARRNAASQAPGAVTQQNFDPAAADKRDALRDLVTQVLKTRGYDAAADDGNRDDDDGAYDVRGDYHQRHFDDHGYDGHAGDDQQHHHHQQHYENYTHSGDQNQNWNYAPPRSDYHPVDVAVYYNNGYPPPPPPPPPPRASENSLHAAALYSKARRGPGSPSSPGSPRKSGSRRAF